MNTFVKLSEAGSIAIHALALLAGLKEGENFSVLEISKVFGVSKDHLSKILQRLSKAGIVESGRGPKGGFRFSKDPKKVRLIEIYELTEGRCDLKQCLIEKRFCFGSRCALGGILSEINQRIVDFLKKTTFDDIAIKNNKGKDEKKNNKNR
jgi:Rrf2 family nitric oxide-sensitive transcriptional repressor